MRKIRKWSMKYKKVLIVIDPKDFLKNNIVKEELVKIENLNSFSRKK